uniref:Large ribosomal subunit protein bL33m n=2 Tax=Melopsittacus undulatus TaxID=13146 RepID=A0A8C6N9K3_MELUD
MAGVRAGPFQPRPSRHYPVGRTIMAAAPHLRAASRHAHAPPPLRPLPAPRNRSSGLTRKWRRQRRGRRAAAGAMFVTVAALAKSKSKYILVRMKSAAETGYCFNVRRLRLQDKLVLYRYDPIAKQRVLFTEKRKIRSL